MTQARDELFLKLALRQGLFSQQEAREFLIRYRSEGGAREGIGEWLVAQGIIAPENAQMIRSAIARRAEGHVDPTRRRVPKRAGGGGGAAPAHPVRHHSRPPRGVKVTPGQQAFYIGAGVLTVIIFVVLIFMYQKSASEQQHKKDNELTASEKAAAKERQKEQEREAAEIRKATAALEKPDWTPEEIASLEIRLDKAIADATYYVGDGKPGKSVSRLEGELEKMGEKLPTEIQSKADEQLTVFRRMCDEEYASLLIKLRSAREKKDEEGVEAILHDIEVRCGESYVEKAKVAN